MPKDCKMNIKKKKKEVHYELRLWTWWCSNLDTELNTRYVFPINHISRLKVKGITDPLPHLALGVHCIFVL